MYSGGNPFDGQTFGNKAARDRARRFAELRAQQREDLYKTQAMYGAQSGSTGQSAGSSSLQQGLGAVAGKAGGFLGGALVRGLSGLFGGGGGSDVSGLWDKSSSLGPSTWMNGFGIK